MASSPFSFGQNMVGQDQWARRGENDARLSGLETRATALEADTGWVTPTFVGTWANYGGGWSPARYRRKGGIVYIQGLVNAAVAANPNVTIFTLPAGFRPIYQHLYAAVANGALARIDVDSTGDIRYDLGPALAVNASNYVDINHSFPAEA